VRGIGSFVAALVVSVAGLACDDPPSDQQSVVLWETGVVSPRFPVAPEASWEPVHQRLRRDFEPGVGDGDLLACYGVADLASAVAFYAEAYGIEPEALPWRPIPETDWSAQRAALAGKLGLPIPGGAPPIARRAELPQRDDLPTLVLETPWLDASTGEVLPGGLVCLHWSLHGTPRAG